MQVLLSEPDIDRLRRTQRIYSELLEREPQNADALHALGVIAHQQGNYQGSLGLLTRAIEVSPDRPRYHVTIGIIHEALGSLDLAIAAYERAISLQPDNSDAHHNLAIALQLTGNAEAAVSSAERATQLRPDRPEFYNTLGYALRQCGRYDCAINSFKKAVSLKADYAEAHNQLGVTLNAVGRYGEAVESYRRAISIDPDYVEAHWNIALVLLLTGRLPEGWKEYKWRRHPDLEMVTYPHALDGPRWDGSGFAGKTLLVHYEQGFGDVLHFVRYLPMVKSRGGTVILEARQPLRGLLETLPAIDLFVEASDRHAPDVHYDFHVSLMDLPEVFGATEATIPADVPYIHADTTRVGEWREHVNTSSLNVGIVWSGSVSYDRNNVRSCRLEDFAPLAAIEGVTLYSLQKGPPVSQIEQCAQSVPVVDLGCRINDFADTAAVIENMDVIISVDTCVLHLAGAMGKPVWALICAAPEWRWLLDREDSPWYPTMRLFRQEIPGRWNTVFECVAEELQLLAESGWRPTSPSSLVDRSDVSSIMFDSRT
jgi:Flp pilus assembly protein TadD